MERLSFRQQCHGGEPLVRSEGLPDAALVARSVKGPMRAKERRRNETMAQITTIHSLKALEQVLANLPEGTTCNVLASDLEAGNFETAHFEFGNGIVQDVQY